MCSKLGEEGSLAAIPKSCRAPRARPWVTAGRQGFLFVVPPFLRREMPEKPENAARLIMGGN